MTNNLFSLTKIVDLHYSNAGIEPANECSEMWGMYAYLRLEGQSSEDAIKGLNGIVRTMTGL